MRFFKIREFNWKYIFGEIFLLFVGINLAIWFNDWNTSKTVQKNKEVALEKIEEEIKANLDQLLENSTLNQKIPAFFSDMNDIRNKDEDIITSSEAMHAFAKKYSEFVEKVDSTAMDNGLYRYGLNTSINLEITDLSSIAWDVSKSTGIFHEFGYDCLYDLQALYNTQDLVKNQMDKATEALRNKSMEELVGTLGFMKQLEDQLEDQYRDMLTSIDDCK
ncbi:hypothetical protein [Allomuricauda sp. CP2A]|jgi:hypothetical protein|uniref:hypothetical protein n=1 Tax=Allomuricauda sp. CP2A TaxID=1848189 RepID=UPI00082B2F32|nr:hypothetical protein [Muricauda sp. CP2A]